MEWEPRAEEIVAEIYRQLLEIRQTGGRPSRVAMPWRFIRRLRVYHFLLGATESGTDYLGNHGIFDLEYYVHDAESIEVS